MGFVYYYTICMAILNVMSILVYATKQDMPKMLGHFIGVLLVLPIYGRIFGWW